METVLVLRVDLKKKRQQKLIANMVTNLRQTTFTHALVIRLANVLPAGTYTV